MSVHTAAPVAVVRVASVYGLSVVLLSPLWNSGSALSSVLPKAHIIAQFLAVFVPI